jgi:hypothetical protein
MARTYVVNQCTSKEVIIRSELSDAQRNIDIALVLLLSWHLVADSRLRLNLT